MVKTIHITLEDSTHAGFNSLKGSLSWKEVLMLGIEAIKLHKKSKSQQTSEK